MSTPVKQSATKAATNSTFVINNEANPPSYLTLFPFENKSFAKDAYCTMNNLPPTLSLDKQDLISYNKMLIPYQISALFQQSNDKTSPSTMALGQLELADEPNEKNDGQIKQLSFFFPKSYLRKHYIFIVASSLDLICFQIVLMTNNGVLSYLASGLWAGLFNLFTLFVSAMACKQSFSIS